MDERCDRHISKSIWYRECKKEAEWNTHTQCRKWKTYLRTKQKRRRHQAIYTHCVFSAFINIFDNSVCFYLHPFGELQLMRTIFRYGRRVEKIWKKDYFPFSRSKFVFFSKQNQLVIFFIRDIDYISKLLEYFAKLMASLLLQRYLNRLNEKSDFSKRIRIITD